MTGPGALGATIAYRTPRASCCGVQMNWLVMMNFQYGCWTQARTWDRSAWTSRPVASGHAEWAVSDSTTGWPSLRAGSADNLRVDAYFHRYLAKSVPDPETRAALSPGYPYGCKRPIYASGWYPMFGRDNVELVPKAVTRVTPGGVVDAWMHSPPHRHNILSGKFREIGIGVARGVPVRANYKGATYATDFGARG